GSSKLQEPCPKDTQHQCWHAGPECFEAPPALLERVRRQRQRLLSRGVELVEVRSSVICTERLNHAKARGGNRFTSDLHAMERLVLALRQRAGENLHAVCG